MPEMGNYPVRRLRISGKPDEVRGYMMSVKDADTGEWISNVTRVVVTLDVREVNQAQVTYLVFSQYKEPVEETITIDNPEIDVTAIEELRD